MENASRSSAVLSYLQSRGVIFNDILNVNCWRLSLYMICVRSSRALHIWRYQLFLWHWQVAGVIRLATRQSQWCKNHQLKLKLAKPQIRRRKASRSMLFIIIFEFGYYLLLDDERSCISATLLDCHAVANLWLFSSLRCYLWFWFIQWHSLTLLQYFLSFCLQVLHYQSKTCFYE